MNRKIPIGAFADFLAIQEQRRTVVASRVNRRRLYVSGNLKLMTQPKFLPGISFIPNPLWLLTRLQPRCVVFF